MFEKAIEEDFAKHYAKHFYTLLSKEDKERWRAAKVRGGVARRARDP